MEQENQILKLLRSKEEISKLLQSNNNKTPYEKLQFYTDAIAECTGIGRNKEDAVERNLSKHIDIVKDNKTGFRVIVRSTITGNCIKEYGKCLDFGDKYVTIDELIFFFAGVLEGYEEIYSMVYDKLLFVRQLINY